MSGECDKPHPFVEYHATAQEVSKFMRINVDILKEEITSHIDKELKRFKDEIQRCKD